MDDAIALSKRLNDERVLLRIWSERALRYLFIDGTRTGPARPSQPGAVPTIDEMKQISRELLESLG